jgi:hypothetical protein
MPGLAFGVLLRWLMTGRTVAQVERAFWSVVGVIIVVALFGLLLEWAGPAPRPVTLLSGPAADSRS